ncbi:hypothetical protein [Variovorax beijingensis]|uniref:hypothetical protein n=1 Tax=Variovorax beijingensis TaxID=2496117 RepID=UPI0013E0B264|nr:hypothetical protein [Variovorax beijingensis]
MQYRYHPIGGKPINLGQDKRAAIQKVLDMNGSSNDAGTITELWRTYQTMPQWKRLGERTKSDYTEYSVKLLEVMGKVSARVIRPADIARYLRVERAAAPVRANREVALLANLMTVAVERGDIDVNPCKQVKRNLERPRTEAPEPETFAAFLAWLNTQGPQRQVIGLMAEFAAMVGSRRIEFLHLTLPQIDSEANTIRLMRAKQHGGATRVESVSITAGMEDLIRRLRALPRPEECLHTSSRHATATRTRMTASLQRGSVRWPKPWRTRSSLGASPSTTCGPTTPRSTRRSMAAFPNCTQTARRLRRFTTGREFRNAEA